MALAGRACWAQCRKRGLPLPVWEVHTMQAPFCRSRSKDPHRRRNVGLRTLRKAAAASISALPQAVSDLTGPVRLYPELLHLSRPGNAADPAGSPPLSGPQLPQPPPEKAHLRLSGRDAGPCEALHRPFPLLGALLPQIFTSPASDSGFCSTPSC